MHRLHVLLKNYLQSFFNTPFFNKILFITLLFIYQYVNQFLKANHSLPSQDLGISIFNGKVLVRIRTNFWEYDTATVPL